MSITVSAHAYKFQFNIKNYEDMKKQTKINDTYVTLNNNNIENVIKIVHNTFEYLRYFGQQENNIYTGECIDISILALPGLLLDLRLDNLLNREDINKVCSIGGKAARTAKILWGMVSQEDEYFVPYLITKTSPLGLLMLRNELSEIKKSKLFDAKYQDYFIINNSTAEPRCAARLTKGKYLLNSSKVNGEVSILFDNDKIDFAVFPKAYNSDNELKNDDLIANNDIITLIKKSNVILLASMTIPHFKEIYNTIINNIDGGTKKLFLDMSRHIEQEKIAPLTSDLNKNKSKIGGIFIPIDNIKLNGFKNIKEVITNNFKSYDIPIIVYGDNFKVTLFGGSRNLVTEFHFDKPINFLKENVSESFKAGILLAYSGFFSINKIVDKEAEENLKELIYQEWGDDKWRIVIQYGIELAKYVQDNGRIDSYFDFIKQYKFNLNGFNLSQIEGKLPASFTDDIGAKTLQLRHSDLRNLIEISRLRREDKLTNPNLTYCVEKKCNKNILCINNGLKNKRAAVLLDLDGTLIDSETQRKRMISIAINQLKEDCKDIRDFNFGTLNESIEVFNEYVYKFWPIFKNTGIGNFRQKWNHPGWYISLLIFYSNNDLFNRVKVWQEEHKSLIEDIELFKEYKVSKIEWLNDFLDNYTEIEAKYHSILQNARNKFNQTKIYPYRGVIDFLISLQQTEAYELYVVTEGEPETQWMKIVNSGLDTYFDRNHVLTTSDAGESSNEKGKIEGEKKALMSEKTNAIKENEKYENTLIDFHKLTDDVEELFIDDIDNYNKITEIVKPHIKNLQKLNKKSKTKENRYDKLIYVADFALAVIKRLSQKGGKAFYSAVIRAILKNQKNTLSELKSFKNLMDDAPIENKMKFVMIGDRQDNDIGWPKALLKEKLFAIRLISSKYAKDEEQREEMTANIENVRRPDYIVHTISQAKLLLLNKNIWNNFPCVLNVPVFDWEIDINNPFKEIVIEDNVPSIGLEYILLGIELHKPKYELINKICSGVFCDYLLDKKEKEITKILNKIFNNYKNCTARRAAVLYEFVKGVISKNYYTVNQNIIKWLNLIIDELGSKVEDSSDIVFMDINDRAYHMQQCYDAVSMLCKSAFTHDSLLKKDLCNLSAKITKIVENDSDLKEKVDRYKCECEMKYR